MSFKIIGVKGRETRETSVEAYHDLVDEGKDGKLQRAVLSVLADGKRWSTRELAHELRGEIDNLRSISPRMAELKRAGKVVDDAEKRCSISNRRVIGWRLAPPGTQPRPRKKKVSRVKLVNLLRRARNTIPVGLKVKLSEEIDEALAKE